MEWRESPRNGSRKKNLPLSLTAKSWQPITSSQAENLTTISCGFRPKGSFRAPPTATVSIPHPMSNSTQSTLEAVPEVAPDVPEPSQVQFIERTFSDFLAERPSDDERIRTWRRDLTLWV